MKSKIERILAERYGYFNPQAVKSLEKLFQRELDNLITGDNE